MSTNQVIDEKNDSGKKHSSRGLRIFFIVVLVIIAVVIAGYLLVANVIGKNWTTSEYLPSSVGTGPVPGSYLIMQPTSPISQNVLACAGPNTISNVRFTSVQKFEQIIVCPLGIGMAGLPRDPNVPPLTPAKFEALAVALAAPDKHSVFGKECHNKMILTNQVLVKVNGQWMWPAVPTDECGMPTEAAQKALAALPHSR